MSAVRTRAQSPSSALASSWEQRHRHSRPSLLATYFGGAESEEWRTLSFSNMASTEVEWEWQRWPHDSPTILPPLMVPQQEGRRNFVTSRFCVTVRLPDGLMRTAGRMGLYCLRGNLHSILFLACVFACVTQPSGRFKPSLPIMICWYERDREHF